MISETLGAPAAGFLACAGTGETMMPIDHMVLSVARPLRAMPLYAALGFTPVLHADGFYIEAGPTTTFFLPPVAGAPPGYLDHFALGVRRRDLDRFVRRLRALGVATNGVEIFGPTGTPYVAFRGLCGEPLEFWAIGEAY